MIIQIQTQIPLIYFYITYSPKSLFEWMFTKLASVAKMHGIFFNKWVDTDIPNVALEWQQ